jgi:hypothetical protein
MQGIFVITGMNEEYIKGDHKQEVMAPATAFDPMQNYFPNICLKVTFMD